MPFQKKWDPVTGTKVSDRTLTGPAVPAPETGTTVQEDGTVIVANQNIQPQVPPATPVHVNFPGPNEPLIQANGLISPRWYRFLDELYRRTGGVVDNINKAPQTFLTTGAPASLVLSGIAPTVSRTVFIFRLPSTAAASLTGHAPTVTVA